MNIIFTEQLSRAASGGLFSSLFIHTISVPPVLHFGNEYQKRMFLPVIKGEKIASLCISEEKYGSDVARMECKAERTADGKHFIVNGNKKWISLSPLPFSLFPSLTSCLFQRNGMDSDFFVTAVRTS